MTAMPRYAVLALNHLDDVLRFFQNTASVRTVHFPQWSLTFFPRRSRYRKAERIGFLQSNCLETPSPRFPP